MIGQSYNLCQLQELKGCTTNPNLKIFNLNTSPVTFNLQVCGH